MKATVLFCILLTTSAFKAFCQEEDAILGTWISIRETEKIEIYKKDNKYFGKLIWLKDSVDKDQKPLKDTHNHDASLRGRSLIGVDILNDLSFARKNIWRGGSVYDTKSGRSYNCQVALPEPSKLNIRKYYGLAIMGRTEEWKRVSN
ncbi:DUF2147 domain-containing protein [Desertivirga brevis]|uniref:DUF2147 domain-containing protein n=1 Tax=Desertivirga brevis TaxID=2810310 RepID=UPI001A9663D6|nr:DUF2147 domain-containing protein [Pedobacter sp. SYSU D00873]